MNRDFSRKWPLGKTPSLDLPIPESMDALTIHRDDYGPFSKVVRMEEVPVPRLNPEDATCVLVAVLSTGRILTPILLPWDNL